MSKHTINTYCIKGWVEKLNKLFHKTQEYIDILDDSGAFLHLAAQNGNIDILKLLIEYYTEHKLSGDNKFIGSDQYLHNLQVLKDRIKTIIDNEEESLPRAVKELFDEFLVEGDDGSDLGDSDTFSEIYSLGSETSAKSLPEEEAKLSGATSSDHGDSDA